MANRKIIAGSVLTSDWLYGANASYPDGDRHCVRRVEPVSTNAGKLGCIGAGDYIRSRQRAYLKINNAGDLNSNVATKMAAFVWKQYATPYWKDRDGEYCADTSPVWLGEEGHSVPHRTTAVQFRDEKICSPAMCVLSRHRTEGGTHGFSAFACWVYKIVGKPTIAYMLLRDDTHEWTTPQTLAQIDDTATFDHLVGCAEMPDGTIAVVATVDSGLYPYRIVKLTSAGVATGILVSNPTLSSSYIPAQGMALAAIGETLHLYSYNQQTGDYELFTVHSEDYGVTWSDPVDIDGDDGIVGGMEATVGAEYRDGTLYLSYSRFHALNNSFRLLMRKSSDGVNFGDELVYYSSPGGAVGEYPCASAIAFDPAGILHCYTRSFGDEADVLKVKNRFFRHWYCGDDPTETEDNWYADTYEWSGALSHYTNANDYAFLTGFCVRNIDGLYNEVLAVRHQKRGVGDEMWSINTFRFGMWSGLQQEGQAAAEKVVMPWQASVYPSSDKGTTDGPYMKGFSGSADVASMANLVISSRVLRIAQVANDDNITYKASLASNSLSDYGLAVRWCCKVSAGYLKVRFKLGREVPDTKHAYGEVILSTTQAILQNIHDEEIVNTVTPTNWNPGTMQEYLLLVQKSSGSTCKVRLFRAPYSSYGEIAPYEQVFYNEAFNLSTMTTPGNFFEWGTINKAGEDGEEDFYSYADVMVNSAGDWKYLHYKNDGDETDWVASADAVGKRCSDVVPAGLAQGLKVWFGGQYGLEDDMWMVDTGWVYDPHNILIPSPSIRWNDPVDVPTSDRVFVFYYRDAGSLPLRWDSFAMFGKNFERFKLEYSDNGSSWTTLWSNASGGTNKGYIHADVKVGASAVKNAFSIKSGGTYTSASNLLTPNQFFSDGNRNYYVRFTSGSAAGRIYKIKSNFWKYVIGTGEQDWIELDDTEDISATISENDTFDIFSDRIFWQIPAFTSVVQKVWIRLTITADAYYPTDEGLRLGTLILGRALSLPDEEWGRTIQHTPNVSVVEGRGGLRQVRPVGPKRRTISMTYTGLQDRGGSVDEVIRAFEACRHGVDPVVWVDDTTAIVADYLLGHCDPILAQVASPVTQRHVAFNYVAEDGSNHIRSINDLDGVTLEEVL